MSYIKVYDMDGRFSYDIAYDPLPVVQLLNVLCAVAKLYITNAISLIQLWSSLTFTLQVLVLRHMISRNFKDLPSLFRKKSVSYPLFLWIPLCSCFSDYKESSVKVISIYPVCTLLYLWGLEQIRLITSFGFDPVLGSARFRCGPTGWPTKPLELSSS